MADFNSLVADVVTLTNRPDLVKETELAVRSATLQLHKSDFYFKDLTEQTLKFDTIAYLQQIPYRTLFPRYRSLSYIRKYDPNNTSTSNTCVSSTGVGDEFEIITPAEIFDDYHIQRVNVCYLAGETINLKSNTQDPYVIIGVYQSPDVSSPENYSSWIATESPDAIVFLAASLIFGPVLGNTNKMNANASQAAISFQEVKNSNIVNKGY